jgi:hypothetical protein
MDKYFSKVYNKYWNRMIFYFWKDSKNKMTYEIDNKYYNIFHTIKNVFESTFIKLKKDNTFDNLDNKILFDYYLYDIVNNIYCDYNQNIGDYIFKSKRNHRENSKSYTTNKEKMKNIIIDLNIAAFIIYSLKEEELINKRKKSADNRSNIIVRNKINKINNEYMIYVRNNIKSGIINVIPIFDNYFTTIDNTEITYKPLFNPDFNKNIRLLSFDSMIKITDFIRKNIKVNNNFLYEKFIIEVIFLLVTIKNLLYEFENIMD